MSWHNVYQTKKLTENNTVSTGAKATSATYFQLKTDTCVSALLLFLGLPNVNIF